MTLVYNGGMAQTNSERQRAFQQRKAARAGRMEAALKQIDETLAASAAKERQWVVKMRADIAEALT